MPREDDTPAAVPPRDPEVQELLVESVRLIARAENLLHQLVDHQIEMAGFLRRAEAYFDEPAPPDPMTDSENPHG